jgi:SAM-dependent methyltransferase
MAADGLDTGFGDVAEPSWLAGAHRWSERLGIDRGASVFEVGCGAGAFLYALRGTGCSLGGNDWSASLIAIARTALPRGRFVVADAGEIDTADQADVVVSFGVFLYFPSLEYSRAVIERMAAKARRVVAILDVPDIATRDAALSYRRASAGGDRAYAERYAGLDHLHHDRSWMAAALRACGLVDVQVADQDLAGYGNAPFRFNAWGFTPGRTGAEPCSGRRV